MDQMIHGAVVLRTNMNRGLTSDLLFNFSFDKRFKNITGTNASLHLLFTNY